MEPWSSCCTDVDNLAWHGHAPGDLLVGVEPGCVCPKARIFALEWLPKEDPTLDTWGFEVNLFGRLDTYVQCRPGPQGPGSRQARGRAAELQGNQLSPRLSAMDGEMASQRFPR